MYYNSFDSYYYSRPVSYCSYNPRVLTKEILPFVVDPESEEVLKYLAERGVESTNLGGLTRGIRFGDLEVGKRVYNHNASRSLGEYYINQWKPTNDLATYHPTGRNFVTKSFGSFMNELDRILHEMNKTYK